MPDARLRIVGSERTTNPVTILSTGLNSLANGSSALSAAVSQTAATERDVLVDYELNLVAPAAAWDEDGAVDLHHVRSVDGTNYEDSDAEGRPRMGYQGTFFLNGVATAQRVVLPDVPAPPRDYKALLINRAGQAFAASGNTLTAYFHTRKADEAPAS